MRAESERVSSFLHAIRVLFPSVLLLSNVLFEPLRGVCGTPVMNPLDVDVRMDMDTVPPSFPFSELKRLRYMDPESITLERSIKRKKALKTFTIKGEYLRDYNYKVVSRGNVFGIELKKEVLDTLVPEVVKIAGELKLDKNMTDMEVAKEAFIPLVNMNLFKNFLENGEIQGYTHEELIKFVEEGIKGVPLVAVCIGRAIASGLNNPEGRHLSAWYVYFEQEIYVRAHARVHWAYKQLEEYRMVVNGSCCWRWDYPVLTIYAHKYEWGSHNQVYRDIRTLAVPVYIETDEVFNDHNAISRLGSLDYTPVPEQEFFDIPRGFFDPTNAEFISHTDPGFGSYLAVNLNYDLLGSEFLSKLENMDMNAHQDINRKLRSRYEAHITIIDPKEYNEVLEEYISIKQINKIALALNIQDMLIEPVCIGEGTLLFTDNNEDIIKSASTYYIVVRAQKIFEIRQAVKDVFVKLGGHPSAFSVPNLSPHITVGFTLLDMFPHQGVIKKQGSCVYNIRSI